MNLTGTHDSVYWHRFREMQLCFRDLTFSCLFHDCFLPVIILLRVSDEWGSITVDHKELLDGGSLWSVIFEDYSVVARAGGAPLLEVSRDATTNGAVSINRVTEAASPVVHRILITAASTLDPTGMFELSLEGVVTRPISVGVSAYHLQNVSMLTTFLASTYVAPTL